MLYHVHVSITKDMSQNTPSMPLTCLHTPHHHAGALSNYTKVPR